MFTRRGYRTLSTVFFNIIVLASFIDIFSLPEICLSAELWRLCIGCYLVWGKQALVWGCLCKSYQTAALSVLLNIFNSKFHFFDINVTIPVLSCLPFPSASLVPICLQPFFFFSSFLNNVELIFLTRSGDFCLFALNLTIARFDSNFTSLFLFYLVIFPFPDFCWSGNSVFFFFFPLG